MKTSDFYFELPEGLIAQHPAEERGKSRLFVLDGDRHVHRMVDKLPEFLEPGTLMVFNDTRVRKARLYAGSASGGQVEVLLLRSLGNRNWECLCSKAKKQKPGKVLYFPGGVEAEVREIRDERRVLHFSDDLDEEYLDTAGHIPLPPYIRREDIDSDSLRYQTVYARKTGSAAAPTAGLHFTPELLKALDAHGIERQFVTLHVGLGTFAPLRTETVEDHRMHTERYSIPAECARAVNRARENGRKILAVGTTSVRCLESAASESGELQAGDSETGIFIYPGYRFRIVDQLFTNFHTPDSSLLLLVSAFAGTDRIRRAYREAVQERYRFFSYGDAMLICRRTEPASGI